MSATFETTASRLFIPPYEKGIRPDWQLLHFQDVFDADQLQDEYRAMPYLSGRTFNKSVLLPEGVAEYVAAMSQIVSLTLSANLEIDVARHHPYEIGYVLEPHFDNAIEHSPDCTIFLPIAHKGDFYVVDEHTGDIGQMVTYKPGDLLVMDQPLYHAAVSHEIPEDTQKGFFKRHLLILDCVVIDPII